MRIQRVQRRIVRTAPFTVVWTFFKFGIHRRRVLLLEWEMLCPAWGLFPHNSHTWAISSSFKKVVQLTTYGALNQGLLYRMNLQVVEGYSKRCQLLGAREIATEAYLKGTPQGDDERATTQMALFQRPFSVRHSSA